jgi:3-dehydroquinate synthase
MQKNFTVKSMRYDYQVVFTPDFRDELKKLAETQKCVFLADKKIWEIYNLAAIISPDLYHVHIIEAIESNKTIYSVIDLWKEWEKRNVTKKAKVIVIGGGILQDLGAFASSAYMRNIDWYFFPTTLLAQCDSCIGSKCGINLEGFKNQIGAFYAPKCIYIDTHFLDTLSEDDLYSGMGEIFKASLTSDRSFFDYFFEVISEKKEIAELENLIMRSLLVKKEIVEADEFEKDYRRVLNYGHTFGHALEAYSNNEIPHGAAVTIGVDIANYIGLKKGFLKEEEYLAAKKVAKCLYRFKFPENIDIERFFYFMQKDKKFDGNIVNLIIPKEFGKLQVYPMEIDTELARLIEEYFSESYEVYRN